MAKRRRGTAGRPPSPIEPAHGPSGSSTNGFLGQIGLFETGNGLPHGPLEIVLAIVAAIVVYPVTRLFRMGRRR